MTHAQKTLDGWRFWVGCQHARKLNMYSKPSDENPGREDVFEDPNYVNLLVVYMPLCSRNLKNVKLRLDFVKI